MPKNKNVALASAVVALLATAPALAGKPKVKKSTPEAETHCAGINACKGKSACNTADNSCKGMNACKGKGWITTATAKECTDKGGSVLPE